MKPLQEMKIGNENIGLWVDFLEKKEANKNRSDIAIVTNKFDMRFAAKSMEERYLTLWETE